jgi:hypothetical protein
MLVEFNSIDGIILNPFGKSMGFSADAFRNDAAYAKMTEES